MTKTVITAENWPQIFSAISKLANEFAKSQAPGGKNDPNWNQALSIGFTVAADQLAADYEGVSNGHELLGAVGRFRGKNANRLHRHKSKRNKPAAQTVAPAPPLIERQPLTPAESGALRNPPNVIHASHLRQSGKLGQAEPQKQEELLVTRLIELMNETAVGEIVFQTYDDPAIAHNLRSRIAGMIADGRVRWGRLDADNLGFMTRIHNSTLYIGRLA